MGTAGTTDLLIVRSYVKRRAELKRLVAAIVEGVRLTFLQTALIIFRIDKKNG